MAREQVGYDPSPEGLRTTITPNFQMVQAQSAETNLAGNKAYQLASALGSPMVQKGIEDYQKSQDAKDKTAAEEFSNSNTVGSVGEQIKSGDLLHSHSAVFNAAVQSTWGKNIQAGLERETLSDISTGKLKFDTSEELDSYLLGKRNDLVAGQSHFAIAGFDAGWNAFTGKAANTNTKLRNDEAVARGQGEAGTAMLNTIQEVTASTFTGDPVAAANAIVEKHKFNNGTHLTSEADRAKNLLNAVEQVAGTGNSKVLKALLDTPLDSGQTVGGVIGGNQATITTSKANGVNDITQRKRIDTETRPWVELGDQGKLVGAKLAEFEQWTTDNQQWLTTAQHTAIINNQEVSLRQHAAAADKAQSEFNALVSVNQVRANIRSSINTGSYSALPRDQVRNTEGNMVTYDHDAYAASYLNQRAVDEKWDFGKLFDTFANNNLTNPTWVNTLQGGASNIASTGRVDSEKKLGQLNEMGQGALAIYEQMYAQNPAVASKYAGGNRQMFEDIHFLRSVHGGFPNSSDAAAIVGQAMNRSISPKAIAQDEESISSEVKNIVNPHFYSSTGNWFSTLWSGNKEVNLVDMESDIGKRANLLMKTGNFTADSAVKASVQYIADPKITTLINNNVYYNVDLPVAPKGVPLASYMEAFIKSVPTKVVTDQKMDASRMRLVADGSGNFIAMNVNQYVHDAKGNILRYSKKDIEAWIQQESDKKKYEILTPKIKQDYSTDGTEGYAP
jgi:hypothetical protein